jgi:glycerophosphoryl diester phosphodiesterase
MTRLSVGGPKVTIAHRGDPSRYPENTLLGVASAISEGADVVEIDVKVTADGEVILLHDLTLQRLWGLSAAVVELTWAEIAERTGGPLGVPRLHDALALLSGTGRSLLIDMDAARWAEPAWRCVRGCIGAGIVDPEQILWCGRDDSLRVVRELDPSARIILSWDELNGGGDPPGDDIVQALRPEAYNPHWPMMSQQSVAWAHERDMAACCWTVDDETTMRNLLRLGVEAMITNQIRTLKRVTDELAR